MLKNFIMLRNYNSKKKTKLNVFNSQKVIKEQQSKPKQRKFKNKSRQLSKISKNRKDSNNSINPLKAIDREHY